MENIKDNEQNTELEAQAEQTSEEHGDIVAAEEETEADIEEISEKESAVTHDSSEEENEEYDPRKRSAARISIICASALLTILFLLGGWLLMVLHGPSATAGEEAVVRMKESAFGRTLLSIAASDKDREPC